MTPKQPPAQKHLEMAKEIVKEYYSIPECDSVPTSLVQDIAAALSQVESEALASKVVGPSDEEIENIAVWATINKDEQQAFENGARYCRNNLTLASNEQVIRVPHMQKIEKAMGCYITIEQQELLEYILPEIKRLNPQARIEESNE